MHVHSKLFAHLFLISLLLQGTVVSSSPFTPTSDSEVLEHLPFKASDPTTRELRGLRQELSANPLDLEKAIALSKRYYQLALADGDPRFIGYAQAALSPWWEQTEPPVSVMVQRATLRQYSHDFDRALADLKLSIKLEPNFGTAWSLLAAISMVQADYVTARQDCEKLQGLASNLIVIACAATVDSLSGKAEQAYNTLHITYTASSNMPAREKLWVLTRLAEISDRLGRADEADSYFQKALKLNIPDAYLLAVYAEFLLDENRNAEVVELLKEKERSDILLMRLALAEKALNLPKAKEHEAVIQARFDAARMRGDKLHIQDESRFNLYFLNNTKEALRFAQENWRGQHEPSDARMLLEAALAAKDRAAAQPALDWLNQSHIEDRHFQKLLKRIQELKS
jgi:tetratricopeptide (TPR) repeat protein